MAPPAVPPGQGLEQVLLFVLLQLSLIIVLGRVAGGTARRLGQPRAVGEMLAGLLLRWLVRIMRRGEDVLTQDLMALLLAAVFLSAIVTNWLGLFAIFGGFAIGMLLHDQRALVEAWKAKAADLVMVFFMPVFFTYTGLRTDVGRLDSAELWSAFALVLLLAVLGKFGGCYLAARWAGLDAASARNVAVMMNTRGLLELVIANVGLDLGVIPPSVFTMLVLMAVLSTMMTAPALRRWLPAGATVESRRGTRTTG